MSGISLIKRFPSGDSIASLLKFIPITPLSKYDTEVLLCSVSFTFAILKLFLKWFLSLNFTYSYPVSVFISNKASVEPLQDG